MNLPNIHLLLNHLPILGTLIALAMFLVALVLVPLCRPPRVAAAAPPADAH